MGEGGGKGGRGERREGGEEEGGGRGGRGEGEEGGQGEVGGEQRGAERGVIERVSKRVWSFVCFREIVCFDLTERLFIYLTVGLCFDVML